MSRNLWGEIEEVKSLDTGFLPVSSKKAKLEESQNLTPPKEVTKNVIVKVKNPYVTQTIEVMKQTEMLQSLIDTYSGSSNYLLNPCQMVPEVDFPPENAADFVNDDKFNKPIWFIPALETPFARSVPVHYSRLNSNACKAALRKAVCGQLRVAGFNDTAETALVLFADAVEEYIRTWLHHIRSNPENTQKTGTVSLAALEKSYFSMNNASLIQVHIYWRSLLARNRSEIAEYKNAFQEYEKLMKESQNMQKEEFQEGDFLNILEIPQTNSAPSAIIQEINTSGNNVRGIFEN